MRKVIALCLCCLLIGEPALAGSTPTPPMALPERDRAIEGGRAVLVEFPQAEIGTEVEVGRVTSDASQYGGGLLGGLILSANDDKRERLAGMENEKATAHVAPLRQAIRDLDVGALAWASTKAAFSHVAWFGAQEPRLVKSSSDLDRRSLLTTAGTRQLATVTYRYGLSPDFTQVRIVADVTLWQPSGSTGNGQRSALSAIYSQRITAITELRQRSYDAVENVAQWSADGGKLARTAIRVGLARMEELIPFTLVLTQGEIEMLRAAKAGKVFAAGFYGPPVKGFPVVHGETLIWSQGLIDVVPSSAGPDAVTP